MRGDGQRASDPVPGSRQRAAIDAVIGALSPDVLTLPQALLDGVPARPPGHRLTRESFARDTGKTFDALGPARAAASLTLDVLLEPQRAARMIQAHAGQADLPGFDALLASLMAATWYADRESGIAAEIQRATEAQVLVRLLILGHDTTANAQVSALALDAVNGLESWLAARAVREDDTRLRAHFALARQRIRAGAA